MVLFPEGTLRRWFFENCFDRPLGWLIYGEWKTVSTECGNELRKQDGGGEKATGACCWMCRFLDLIEKDHCRRNAGEP